MRSSLTGYLPRGLTTCFGVHSKSKGKITEVRTEAKSFFGEKTEVVGYRSKENSHTVQKKERKKERKKEKETQQETMI